MKKYVFPKLPILSTTVVDFGVLHVMILVPRSRSSGGGSSSGVRF